MEKNSEIVVKAVEAIGSRHAVTPDDAQKLFEVLQGHMDRGVRTVVDFTGIETVVSLFFCLLVNKLHEERSNPEVCRLVRIVGLSDIDNTVLHRVVMYAIDRLENPQNYEDVENEE